MGLSADQARLRPHLREPVKDTGGAGLGAQVEESPEVLASSARGRTVVPSPGSLRGLPVIGGGPGAIAGTNPAAALIAKEQRRN